MTALPDYLKQHAALIHDQDVANHGIDFNLQLWEKYFADSAGWADFHGRCAQSTITRGDLSDWEIDLDRPESIRAYFLAVMAWGYGRGNRPNQQNRRNIFPTAVD